jgi:hypothetical protein
MTTSENKEEMRFTQFRKSQIAEMRPYESGEMLSDKVSISASDKENGSPKIGDMIARNPKNHDDQWLVAADYFKDNFESITPTPSRRSADSWTDEQVIKIINWFEYWRTHPKVGTTGEQALAHYKSLIEGKEHYTPTQPPEKSNAQQEHPKERRSAEEINKLLGKMADAYLTGIISTTSSKDLFVGVEGYNILRKRFIDFGEFALRELAQQEHAMPEMSDKEIWKMAGLRVRGAIRMQAFTEGMKLYRQWLREQSNK